MQLRIGLTMMLLAVGLAACAPEIPPTPQQTAETELAEPVPVTVERVEPTHTTTPIPTNTPEPTSTPIPVLIIETPVPEPTSTPILPTVKPTPLPLKLHQTIKVLTVNDVDALFWSPVNHEFVQYAGCRTDNDTIIQLVKITDEEIIDIAPANLSCYVSVLWHPTGEYLMFSSTTVSKEGFEDSRVYGWKVNLHDFETIELGQDSYYWGWFKDDIRISEARIGTGAYSIGLYDVEKEEGLGGTSFDGGVKNISNNFVILNEELGFSYNTSVAILAQDPISPEYAGWLFGTYIKFFGKSLNDSGWEVSYYSRYADVLPKTDQILAVTWEEPLLNELDPGQLVSGTISANLQLINAQTDELTMFEFRKVKTR